MNEPPPWRWWQLAFLALTVAGVLATLTYCVVVSYAHA